MLPLLAAVPSIVSGLGSLFGGGSKAKAEQRAAQAEAARDQEYLKQSAERNYFDTMLAREQEKRQAMDQGWKRTQQADFLANAPAQSMLGLSRYSRPVQGPGQATRQTASDPLLAEVLKRQTTGQADPFGGMLPTRTPDFTVWNKAMKPGFWEQLMGYAGAGLTGFGNAELFRNAGSSPGFAGTPDRPFPPPR